MTEKRYTYSELNNRQYAVRYTTFKEIYGEENIFHNRICAVNTKKQAQKVVDLLNNQEEEIISLKSTNMELEDANARLEEQIKELQKRNDRQYKLLSEITDLMMKRDWKELEQIVEDWEESDRLLQAEWGNCGDL